MHEDNGQSVGTKTQPPSKRIRIFMNGLSLDLPAGENMIQTIGVIGAGQMGNGIAQVAACAGYDS